MAPTVIGTLRPAEQFNAPACMIHGSFGQICAHAEAVPARPIWPNGLHLSGTEAFEPQEPELGAARSSALPRPSELLVH